MNKIKHNFIIFLTMFCVLLPANLTKAAADPTAVTVTFDYATESNIAIQWTTSPNVQKYVVYVKSQEQYKSWTEVASTTATSYVLKNCSKTDTYQFKVKACGPAMSVMSSVLSGCKVFNTDGPIVKIKKVNSSKGVVHLVATVTGEVDSFVWEYKTVVDNNYYSVVSESSYVTLRVPNTAAVYDIKCTAVRTMSNGTRYLTSPTTVKYIPQPAFTAKHKKGPKLLVKITPVTGATGYTVQTCSKTNSKWVKVATISADKKSVTIEKYKGKNLVKGKTYYVRVRTDYGDSHSLCKTKKKVRFSVR